MFGSNTTFATPMIAVPEEGPLQVTVVRVHYHVSGDGKVNSVIVTHPILPEHLRTCTGFIDVDVEDVHVGDRFQVERRNGQDIHWTLVQRGPAGSESVQRELNHCPACHEQLTYEEDGQYCLADDCPARIRTGIYRFLTAAGIVLLGYEKTALDLLIRQEHLRNLVDLFTIREEDIMALSASYTKVLASQLIEKIHSVRGRTTVAQYLRGLNLAHLINWGLNEEAIDQAFQTMSEFLQWLSLTQETPNSGPGQFMSVASFQLLCNYFTIPENAAIVQQLQELGLFR